MTTPRRFAELDSTAVTTRDGTAFTVRFLHGSPDEVVLILPAMAMKAKHYHALATSLHELGVSVATSDLRAQGEATPSLAEAADFGYREMIEIDLPAIVSAVRSEFPEARIHLFGHSLGGQLALLYAAAEPGQVDGIITIGTGTVFWYAFGPRRWWEALSQIQWIGLVSRWKGRWPGGVLIPAPMSGRVMRDWSMHSLTSYYRPKGTSRRYNSLLRRLTSPALVISLDEDVLGPKSNVDFLATRIPEAALERWHIDRTSGVHNLDHFGWVKDSDVIAARIAAWIHGR